MAFISSVKMLLRFDNSSLMEEITGEQFLLSGNGPVDIRADGNGINLKRDQFIFRTGNVFGISNKMSLGFWLKSTHPGASKNPTTGNTDPMRTSVLDFGVGDIDPYSGQLEISEQTLIIHEIAHQDGTMKIKVILEDTLGAVYEATSESYLADKVHHFWFSFNGDTSEFKIFVDGVEQALFTSGSVPATINGTLVAFAINRLALVPRYDTLNHNGLIDDVIVLNDAVTSNATLQRIINYSVDYAFDTSFMDIEEIDYALFYDDTTPIAVTDAHDDGVFYYATRNDGKILRGSPLLWETRRDFSNDNETEVLDSFGTGVELVDGELKVTKGTIKL